MKALDRLESLIGDLLEGPGRLLSTAKVHPRAIGAAITNALEDTALPLADRVVAPDAYIVRLHPDDLASLSNARRTLERELAGYVDRLAEERDLTLHAPASVAFAARPESRRGEIKVETRFTAEQASKTIMAGRPRDGGHTERISPAAVEAALRDVARAAGTTSTLEFLNERGEVTQRRNLAQGEHVIGRRSSCEIAVADGEVSRQHARLVVTTESASVEDLESTNGTWLNGRRIGARMPLNDGDLIEIGRTRLRFRRGTR